eukprot:CAMPEP_0194712724 /NCGR_PEP_ID=MMETSP0296-20130528/4739_1 /TAXON_ID=39354 /ORGANISM="Heterosigma akashiwo, Strain CCMP2393" /LENGTH=326 /DNA_ID=CAMNT_0039611219 /DNA_START=28 /DNA_END=1008 /DNA_ORIENTATION=+
MTEKQRRVQNEVRREARLNKKKKAGIQLQQLIRDWPTPSHERNGFPGMTQFLRDPILMSNLMKKGYTNLTFKPNQMDELKEILRKLYHQKFFKKPDPVYRRSGQFNKGYSGRYTWVLKNTDTPEDVSKQKNAVFLELMGCLHRMLASKFVPGSAFVFYLLSILKNIAAIHEWIDSQQLHMDDLQDVVKWSLTIVFNLSMEPARLRVVPGSHLIPYAVKRDPQWKPKNWVIVKVPKNSCIIFFRSLAHGGHGYYTQPHVRLHSFLEVLPPGVELKHCVLHRASATSFFPCPGDKECVDNLEKEFDKKCSISKKDKKVNVSEAKKLSL